MQSNISCQPKINKISFFMGFFAGLAFISLVSFATIVSIVFSGREPVNLGVQAAEEEAVEQDKFDTPPPQVEKSSKPKVEVFVMSHCPYGTQIEKGLIPVVTLLGDKIDFNVRFVYYAMHGEKEVKEELNQYCIQKEQRSKYLSYLVCFLGEGKGEDCLKQIGIDQKKLKTCVAAADKKFAVTANLKDKNSWLNGRYPLVNLDKDLNDKYDISGSPTLVINGTKVSVNRDSASLLAAVCAAFDNPPEECSRQLNSDNPSPGFGFGTTGDAAAAECGD